MKPVHQSEFGIGQGNCLSACVASILELPIEAVPDFASEGLDQLDGLTWLQRLGNWLAGRGWGFVQASWNSDAAVLPFNCYVIVIGPTDRGEERHAVIGSVRQGATVREAGGMRSYYSIENLFDPYPGGGFLTSIEELLILVPGM